MKPVSRDEIVDYVTWTEQRPTARPGILAAKELRRIHVDHYFTFLFENRDTIRYQVQEMMRVERIVKESEIVHELTTYNDLLGGPGELGCTLLIGLDDEAQRDEALGRWLGLLEHIYLRMKDGSKLRASWDPRQVGSDRLSAVQYLRFAAGDLAPTGIGIDFTDPLIGAETTLSGPQRAALQADLSGD